MNKYIPDLEKYFDDYKYNLDQSITGIRWLVSKFREVKPKIYLEIGAASLYTFEIFASELPTKEEGGLAIGIDIHPNRADWFTYKSLSGYDHLLIHGSSIDKSTLDQVRSKLASRTIDWLFIDGNHYEEFVRLEWELYSPLVTSGGLIVFHDCDPPALEAGYRDGQGAAIVFTELLKNGYTGYLVPGSTIGTGVIVKP